MNKMLKHKKTSFFLVFLILTSFISIVYSTADSYGNQITGFTFQQKEAGAWVTRGSATNDTFTTGMNITIEPEGNFLLYASGSLNATWVSDYVNATNYSHYAMGIQIFDNITYANPFYWTLPTYQTNGFWVLPAVDMIDNNIVANTTVCNITEWINYQNGSGWLLAEEWVFNLQTTIIPETTTTYTESLNMSIFYFWSFIITLFGSTIMGVLTFKGGGAKTFIFFLFCFMFCITFYSMLSVSVL